MLRGVASLRANHLAVSAGVTSWPGMILLPPGGGKAGGGGNRVDEGGLAEGGKLVLHNCYNGKLTWSA